MPAPHLVAHVHLRPIFFCLRFTPPSIRMALRWVDCPDNFSNDHLSLIGDAIKISILDEDVTVNKPECNSCYFMYVM